MRQPEAEQVHRRFLEPVVRSIAGSVLKREDDEALAMLENLYPDRKVVGVPSTAIPHEGGGVGCVTQQQPAGPLATGS